jgi:hypothetical protein
MASSYTLFYTDYIVLFIGRPTDDRWEGGLLGHAVFYADCLVLFIDLFMYGEWEGRSVTFWRLKLLLY